MNFQQPPYGQQGPYRGPYPSQGPLAPGPGQAGHPPAPPQQPYYGYGQQPQPGAPYQNQPYPSGPPQNQQYPPTGAPQQQHQGQGQAYPPYGAPPPGAPYGQPPYQQQPYGAPPPAQNWQPQSGYPPAQPYNVQPTPASPGYDPAQRQWVQHIDTTSDVEVIRKAMKGMGCDERALIRVFAAPKYQNPWAMAQLVRDYNSRFTRDLAKDIKGETKGNFETALLALIRGPLENDVFTLDKALDRAGTDEESLMDVLLCRSNADIRAITTEYRRVKGRDLLLDIKDDVNDTLFRLYGMVLSATRAEDAAPVITSDIDHKITELQRATEGTIGANAAQLRAMSEAYQRKYHRSLQNVIEREFRGDMEDVLLRMLTSAVDRARVDAEGLRGPLMKTISKDKLFINRALRLHWDRDRLMAAQAAYRRIYGKTLGKQVKEQLSGDYGDLMVALIGDK